MAKERTAASGPGSIGLSMQPAHPDDPPKGIVSASEYRARALGTYGKKAITRNIETALKAEKPDDTDRRILERDLRRLVKAHGGFRKDVTGAERDYVNKVLLPKLGRSKVEWDKNIAIEGFLGVKPPKEKIKGAGQRRPA